MTYSSGFLTEGPHTLSVRATDAAGNTDQSPATYAFTVDTRPPETVIDDGPDDPVHAGPIAFGVRSTEPGTIECALDGAQPGSCAALPRAEDLALGEHVYRARATDRAGNVDPSPAQWRFIVVNTTPAAALELQPGEAPLTALATITAADADRDPLTYRLDFGDGQVQEGTLPAGPIVHTFAAAGEYTAVLEVRDRRQGVVVRRTVTVAAPQPAAPAPVLSLELSDAAGALGTFTPGLQRDYAAALAATVTSSAGPATLTVTDPSPTATGHLVNGAHALRLPLQARATGAFAPLPLTLSTRTGPVAIEFLQTIDAAEALRTGPYAKPLTFRLTPAGP
jgi:hypothetical protein